MGQGGHGWKKILMNDKKSMWMDEFKYKCISSVFFIGNTPVCLLLMDINFLCLGYFT